MRRIVIMGLLVITAAASVFANGKKDDVQPGYGGYGMAPYGGGPRSGGLNNSFPCGPGMMYWVDDEGNPVTPDTIDVEGNLVLEEGTIPFLESDGKKVFLMVPPQVLFSIELENGTFAKVSGYDVTDFNRMNWGDETDSVFLHVLSAEMDGKTLVLENRDGPLGGGRGRGRW